MAAQPSLLDDLGEEVTGIMAPVSLCMAVTVLLVRLLNPEGISSTNTVIIASIAYQEQSSDSSGKKLGGALLNAIIFVGVVAGMTVVLFLLFKYKCYKLIYAYMGFAVFNIFFFITGALFIQVMQIIHLHIDAFSLAYGLFNFSVVGTAGLLFVPIPLLAKQVYLIWVGIIVAYIFTFIPEWTAWVILVFMALYDIAAVLIPGGPLKALVELAIERKQELPALIYEARPAGGRPYVRGWGNRAPRNGEQQQEGLEQGQEMQPSGQPGAGAMGGPPPPGAPAAAAPGGAPLAGGGAGGGPVAPAPAAGPDARARSGRPVAEAATPPPGAAMEMRITAAGASRQSGPSPRSAGPAAAGILTGGAARRPGSNGSGYGGDGGAAGPVGGWAAGPARLGPPEEPLTAWAAPEPVEALGSSSRRESNEDWRPPQHQQHGPLRPGGGSQPGGRPLGEGREDGEGGEWQALPSGDQPQQPEGIRGRLARVLSGGSGTARSPASATVQSRDADLGRATPSSHTSQEPLIDPQSAAGPSSANQDDYIGGPDRRTGGAGPSAASAAPKRPSQPTLQSIGLSAGPLPGGAPSPHTPGGGAAGFDSSRMYAGGSSINYYGGPSFQQVDSEAVASKAAKGGLAAVPPAGASAGGVDPTMGVRAVPPAIGEQQLAAAVSTNSSIPPATAPPAPVPGPRRDGDPAEAAQQPGQQQPGQQQRRAESEDDGMEVDLPDAIKLGLGDFIFYSMLVGRAAMYDFMTVFSSYLAIIAGLGLTLLCLAVFQKALPALPFSIALGVAFYFLTRLTLEPFLVPLAVNMAFY